MVTSYAKVRTSRAGEYLIGLCRVWHRTLPDSGEAPTHIEVPFPNGHVAIDATADQLEFVLTAGSIRDTALLEDLVSDHLDRLSCDEDIHYEWIDTNVEPTPHASRRVFDSV
jgi:hypothetical protein